MPLYPLRIVLFLFALLLSAATPELIYVPRAPFHIAGNQIVDATGHPFLLRGTAMPFRTPAQTAVLNGGVFSQIGLRWNMNVLRLQISLAMDAADPTYLAQVKRVVHDANAVQLVVILAPHDEEETNGAATPRMVPFWQKWAAAFRDEPLVLFDLYSEPKSTLVNGHVPGTHTATDWHFWRLGGSTIDGTASP
ncbi:MAG TPA: cellulase family glycosylhydrolase, partial [Bryobacteraceae bacterium]|nr:cellulase family glycosylhydrolase [Bryobacteraceae bacterium]